MLGDLQEGFGAQGRGVLISTVTRGLRPVVVGVVLGMALALLLGPLIGEGLLDSNPRDPWVLSLVPLALLLGAAQTPPLAVRALVPRSSPQVRRRRSRPSRPSPPDQPGSGNPVQTFFFPVFFQGF